MSEPATVDAEAWGAATPQVVAVPALHAPAGELYRRFGKPLLDRVGAALLLVVLVPVLAAVAVAVLVTLGRPVLFIQQRVGLDGRTFGVVKFRTMHPDRRRQRLPYVGPERRREHKAAHDPRHTRLGRLLRAWSLDELPQLWNVLRGDMSLVGPRPELVDVVARYAPWQHARHQVKPGITCLWQISERGDTPLHECTHLDLAYVARLSLREDLRILLATLPAALGARRGA